MYIFFVSEILTGNVVTESTQAFQIDEEYIVATDKITLKSAPSTGEPINIFVIDEFGRDSDRLVVGDPSTKESEYSIAGSVITFSASKNGKKVHIYYATDKAVTEVVAKPGLVKNYRFEADLLCKDIETKDAFIAKLIIPNGKIQEQFSMTTANSADEPASIPLAIDCLEDSATGKFYSILFTEDVRN